jgi:cytochrome c-type biogenesis protein CcmH/NrfG
MLGWLILQHAGGAEHVHQHVFRCLDRAFKRDPLCEQVLYYKGMVLNVLGDHEQAQAHFQRVLMLKPDHADAEREVRIHQMRKEHARSESSFLRRLMTGRPKPG